MINLIGYFCADNGLGVVARNIATAMLRRGKIPECSSLDGGAADECSFDALRNPKGMFTLRYPSTLLICGATIDKQVADLVLKLRGRTQFGILPFWELTEFATDSASYLEAADFLFGGSGFLTEILQRSFPRKPCIEIPCPLDIDPGSVEASRQRFGLPESTPLALVTFDPQSDLERKNVVGAVKAFLGTADQHEGKLVLKVNWPTNEDFGEAFFRDAPAYLHRSKEILDSFAGNERIVFLNRRLPYRDLLSLTASVDVVLSLHRSEGLGLVMLEAMLLGRAVIATGYSGNCSFMPPSHPGLVRYRTVAVESAHPFYQASRFPRTPTWAEPDLVHAGELLASMMSNRSYARAVGEAGRKMAIDYVDRANALTWLG